MLNNHHISVVIPAKDEQDAIGHVVQELRGLRNADQSRLIDHIVVCDNGSSDETESVALSCGADVVKQELSGYGIACLTAMAELDEHTDIVLFIDGDHSCNTEQAFSLCEAITQGVDLVIGSRKLGVIEPGSMTFAQRFGTGLACMMLRLLYRKPVTDLGPYRAIKKSKLDALNMQDKRFGWTVEMQAKALGANYKIREIPVDCKQRIGVSKISGTVSGVIGAGKGIIGTIFKIWWQQRSERSGTALLTSGKKREA